MTCSALEAAFNENTAGIVLEFIQGEGGIYPVSEAFARKARELADKYNALLVFDEIQCGVGRPRHLLRLSVTRPGVLPDIVIAAKPMACGIPLGVIICKRKGCRGHQARHARLDLRRRTARLPRCAGILRYSRRAAARNQYRGRILPHATDRVDARSSRSSKKCAATGLMIGVELEFPGKQLVIEGMKEGVLFNCTHETVLRFLPPYILTEQDVDRGLAALTRVFRNAKPA